MHQYVSGFANSETVAERVSTPPGHLRMQRLVALFAFWIPVGFGLFNAPWIKPLVRAFTRSLVSLSVRWHPEVPTGSAVQVLPDGEWSRLFAAQPKCVCQHPVW